MCAEPKALGQAGFAPDTTSARLGVSWPTGASGSARQRWSATTRAKTASPRKARRSLSAAGACSLAHDRWVRARVSSSPSRNACPSCAPNAGPGPAWSVNRAGAAAPSYSGRYLRNTRVALVPPKPNALLSATSTSCFRA